MVPTRPTSYLLLLYTITTHHPADGDVRARATRAVHARMHLNKHKKTHRHATGLRWPAHTHTHTIQLREDPPVHLLEPGIAHPSTLTAFAARCCRFFHVPNIVCPTPATPLARRGEVTPLCRVCVSCEIMQTSMGCGGLCLWDAAHVNTVRMRRQTCVWGAHAR